ncbi:MAG: glycerol-3-phosphate 1-O-acyltransferase PlsY [Vicinamibacterales bacterium]
MTLLGATLIGYLIGSAPLSYLVVWVARGIDLRREGSGNVGATNVYRTSGAFLGLSTLLMDIAKGVVSVMWAGPGEAAVVAGTAAVAGHVYPVWLGFRGGKGVATATGAFAVMAPIVTAGAVVVFVAVVAATRYVSLGSVLAACALCAGAWWLGPRAVAVGASAVTALILLAHRGNLARLWAGTERSLRT